MGKWVRRRSVAARYPPSRTCGGPDRREKLAEVFQKRRNLNLRGGDQFAFDLVGLNLPFYLPGHSLTGRLQRFVDLLAVDVVLDVPEF